MRKTNPQITLPRAVYDELAIAAEALGVSGPSQVVGMLVKQSLPTMLARLNGAVETTASTAKTNVLQPSAVETTASTADDDFLQLIQES